MIWLAVLAILLQSVTIVAMVRYRKRWLDVEDRLERAVEAFCVDEPRQEPKPTPKQDTIDSLYERLGRALDKGGYGGTSLFTPYGKLMDSFGEYQQRKFAGGRRR